MTETHDDDYSSQPVMLIRLRSQDDASDTPRVAHIVPVQELVDGVPELLTAWCGSEIAPPDAEMLFATGTPCEQCLSQEPIPQGASQAS